jgi:hypothetical protein
MLRNNFCWKQDGAKAGRYFSAMLRVQWIAGYLYLIFARAAGCL